MDLLCSAYSNSSDEDDPKPGLEFPPPKRSRSDYHFHPTTPAPGPMFPPFRLNYPRNVPRQEVLIPGRYVSKRERALLEPGPTVSSDLIAKLEPGTSISASSVFGNVSDTGLPRNILSSLRHQASAQTHFSKMPDKLSVSLTGHTKAVNMIQWSASHPHLLASAGMDHTVCIWNPWNPKQKKTRVLTCHSAAVKDVKWSLQGMSVLSCGYDCSSRLVDVEKGIQTQVFKEDQVIGVVKFHPFDSNLFLSGGMKGLIKLYDIRSGKMVHEYNRRLGPILDIEFIPSAKQFITSSDVSGSNLSENSIIVWDVVRQIPLSDQVYVEAYTCPCIRSHPFDPIFVAQSNGNYIAIFSSTPPYKLDKYKRYEGHGVSGFPVKCNFSLDGEKVVSGSSDGCIYLYNYRSSKLLQKIKAYEQACIDVAFHPIIPNVIASCSWNGDVSVFE